MKGGWWLVWCVVEAGGKVQRLCGVMISSASQGLFARGLCVSSLPTTAQHGKAWTTEHPGFALLLKCLEPYLVAAHHPGVSGVDCFSALRLCTPLGLIV